MDELFEVHMLNYDGKEKAKAIAEAFDRCLSELRVINPLGGRYMAIVGTKLEEACFFAKKEMASHRENQDNG